MERARLTSTAADEPAADVAEGIWDATAAKLLGGAAPDPLEHGIAMVGTLAKAPPLPQIAALGDYTPSYGSCRLGH